MSGFCVVAGTLQAALTAGTMMDRLARYGQQRREAALAPDIAAGQAFHGRLAHDRGFAAAEDGVTVLVAGEIFDDNGPLADPASLIRSLYADGNMDRCAWLNGSFAALVVDASRRRVVIATDRLGSRTVFVWHDGANLSAATRLEALLQDRRVPRRLSFRGFSELFCYQRTVFDHTQYADIAAIPAGQVWTWQDGRLDRRQVRRLAWNAPAFKEAEGGERLAEVLVRAARRRTADRVRHGILMSGGLDSRLVLAATIKAGGSAECFTTACYDNNEVKLARRCAEMMGVPFHFLPSDLDRLVDGLVDATLASDGLFNAPLNLYSLWPAITAQSDALLSGHGLDYTFRGYYLPCVMLRVAGSNTRLPRLRPIPDGQPGTVAASLRVGMDPEAVRGVLRPELHRAWEERTVEAMATVRAAADVDNAYDAWDAFILHSLGRHYAYSDFVAMENYAPHRPLTFDTEVYDLYLSMPPEWRARGRIAQDAMCLLGPELMELPDNNSGIRASRPFPQQIALILARAVARRLGLAARPQLPDPCMTAGSWPDYVQLYRRHPAMRAKVEALASAPALLDTNLFDAKGVARAVDAHLSGTKNNKRLIAQLLTLASWNAATGFDQVVHD